MNDTNFNELNIENLSDYRERKNLSVADVANTIKVSREVIKHIEQGSFNKIGAPTFIKGHVTNYAKAIGLDPQTLLALIPAEQLTPHSLKLTNTRVSSPLSRVKTRSSGFGKYVFGTFLVAALALSFYFVYDKWGQQPENNVQLLVEQQSDQPIIPSNNEKRVIYSSLLPQSDMGSGNQSNNTQVSENATVADDEVEEAPQPETETEMDLDGSEAETATLDEAENDETNLPIAETPAADGKYQIKLELTEQAWVSIEGQDGSRIVADLMGPGERSYSANQSLRFRIGNASEVTLTINDKVIDLAASTQQNVAKLDWPPVVD